MNVNTVIWLLFAHWIADFVCQSDWMAQNKSKSFTALFVHCGFYSIIIWIFAICLNGYKSPMMNFLSAILVAHLIVDAITSRINSKLWADKKVHWFFVSVGFDQWIHFVTILLVYNFCKV